MVAAPTPTRPAPARRRWAALGLALAAVGAQAREPDPSYHLQEIRWSRVPATPETTGDLALPGRPPLPVQLVYHSGEVPLGASCPEGVVPRRYLLATGSLVEGPWSEPRHDGERWVFESAPREVYRWAVSGDGCLVDGLVARRTARGFDRLERGERSASAVVHRLTGTTVFPPDEAEWLGRGEGTFEDRYRLLRPPATAGPGQRQLTPERGLRLREDRQIWWQDPAYTVRGPARLHLEAYRVGGAEEICLFVDDHSWCREVRDATRVVRVDRHLEAQVGVRDGDPVSAPRSWWVLLPAGTHLLRWSPAVVARVAASEVDGLGRPLGPRPEVVTVYPPSEEDDGPQWSGVSPDDPETPRILLARPTALAPEDDGIHWARLDQLPWGSHPHWLDEQGISSFWLVPTGGRCVVEFADGTRFASRPGNPFSRFVYTGDPTMLPALPAFEGCVGYVRLLGGPTGADRLVLLPFQEVGPGETVQYTPTEAGPGTAVWLSWAPGSETPVRVEVDGSDGTTAVLTALPVPGGETTVSGDGRVWSLPSRVPLPGVAVQVRITSSTSVAARLTHSTPPQEQPPPLLTSAPVLTEVSLQALRALSTPIAEGHDGVRLQRAAILHALGQTRYALDDQRWLDVDRDLPLPVSRERSFALLLVGEDRWLPTSARWLRASPDLDESALDHAAAGDFLAVAGTGADLNATDRLRTWLAAVSHGQILTAEQRVQAYVDLVWHLGPHRRDHAFWATLRGLSSWQSVAWLPRSGPPQWRLWPTPPEELIERSMEDALFPSRWPVERTATLALEREVRIPAGSELTSLPVRCRARTAEAMESRCVFAALDDSGRVRSEVEVDPRGWPSSLALSAADGVRYLVARPTRDVVAQALLPPPVARELLALRQRRAWLVRPGAVTTLEVVGPTVVRLWPHGDGTLQVGIVRPGDTRDARVVRLQDGEPSEIAVRHHGPVQVQLEPDQPLWLAAEIRVPRAHSHEPGSDRLLLQDLRRESAPAEVTVALDPEPVEPLVPRGRPAALPPLTGVAGLQLGSDPSLDEPLPDTAVRLHGWAGVESRPGRPRLWLRGRVQGVLSTTQPPVERALFGAEWMPLDDWWRALLTADLHLAHGSPDQLGLTTASAITRLDLGRWVHRRVLTYARLRWTERWILAGAERGGAGYGDLPVLWSSYRTDHPRALQPSVGVRWMLGHHAELAGQAHLVTNAIPTTVDHYGGDLHLDLARPGSWLRLGLAVDQWIPDPDRDARFTIPSAYASAWTMWWPTPNLGIQWRLTVRAQAVYPAASFLLGPTVYLSRDRALRDVRPSSMALQRAAAWHQDRAADRRWAVVTP